MVKIISRKSLGIQAVYDIGVEKNHNFILENGAVASNCFNKSHSTAYSASDPVANSYNGGTSYRLFFISSKSQQD